MADGWTFSPKRESSGFRNPQTSAISNCCGFYRFLSFTVSGLPEMAQRFGSPKCMRGMVLVSGSPPAWKFLLTSSPSTLPKAKDCVWFLRCLFGSSWTKKQIQLEELKFRLKTMIKPWVPFQEFSFWVTLKQNLQTLSEVQQNHDNPHVGMAILW